MDEDLDRVDQALGHLYRENSIWRKNYMVFSSMDDTAQHLWWQRAKKQAELGAPAMQTLLLKVIELRLTK